MNKSHAGADMRREFPSREEMIHYLREQFPQASRWTEGHHHAAETRGGRQAAESLLEQIDPAAYAATRNHLEGRVTRLSPYLRHGVISLDEVHAAVLARAKKRDDAGKLVQELAWRDYFQRLYHRLGVGIWEDVEPYKTGFAAHTYAHDLPADVMAAETGTCMDPLIRQLYRTGYLPNRGRLWLAAYIIHWRRVRWQAGACWFLMHLLDGDPASNNLSWQWVASTFSQKPYYYNLDNLKQFGAETEGFDNAPFEGSYEEVAARLFPHKPAGAAW